VELAVEMVSLPHATTNNGPSLDKISIISFFVSGRRISCRLADKDTRKRLKNVGRKYKKLN